MNQDVFNIELRKFLKQVGVTSQRAIEQAVAQALAEGRLSGSETLKARMVLTVEAAGLTHEVVDEIALD
ncbi:DUF6494 family protein [Oleisolibacter albus]|uniref:DUF6494 family protein n=1 Tax=Oleisolibacter albus TaxID=2171757 RepID=UPI000DF4BDA2|nr:DUF6494 family protein [Oleisolibacter albus]